LRLNGEESLWIRDGPTRGSRGIQGNEGKRSFSNSLLEKW
jgi:hypothetical protein